MRKRRGLELSLPPWLGHLDIQLGHNWDRKYRREFQFFRRGMNEFPVGHSEYQGECQFSLLKDRRKKKKQVRLSHWNWSKLTKRGVCSYLQNCFPKRVFFFSIDCLPGVFASALKALRRGFKYLSCMILCISKLSIQWLLEWAIRKAEYWSYQETICT